MKKIIFAMCLVFPVMAQADTLPTEEILSAEITRQVETQQSKKTVQAAQVHQQLEQIAARLQQKLGKEVTPRQVVGWLYLSATGDFESVAYYQFKWERGEKLGDLLISKNATQEEIDEFARYIPIDSPEVKEFTTHLRHVVDYAFAQVFSLADRKDLYDYGSGPTDYSSRAYVPVKDAKKFTKDTQLEIQRLRERVATSAEAAQKFDTDEIARGLFESEWWWLWSE